MMTWVLFYHPNGYRIDLYKIRGQKILSCYQKSTRLLLQHSYDIEFAPCPHPSLQNKITLFCLQQQMHACKKIYGHWLKWVLTLNQIVQYVCPV